MPRPSIRVSVAILAIVTIGVAAVLAGCGAASRPRGEAVARAFVEKLGWHPTGSPAVSQVTVPTIQPGSHDDVSNVLLADAGLDLMTLAGQKADVYNFRLADKREGNLVGLPLHAVVWIQESKVVASWILPQGDTGDPAKDTYRGGFYSIQGRTLEEVTGQDFQAWRQSRVSGSSQDPAAKGSVPNSPVTWTMSSLDQPWMQAPMSVRLMLPQSLRLSFSGLVDRASVESTLRRELGAAYAVEAAWTDDKTLDFTVKSGHFTDRFTFLCLSPAGGRDQNGLTLQASDSPRGPVEFRLGIGPSSEVWRWAKGDKPRLVAALPGAFDVLSVSPDGSKFALRLFGVPHAGGWPPVGPPPGFAYWYDWSTQRLERLQAVSGWLSPQWLADGTLIISGSHFTGTTLMRVTPDGKQTALVEKRNVVDYAVAPDGRRMAVFLEAGAPGDWEAKGDLWLFDLSSGKRQEFKGAFTPARSPNDVAEVTALWSPDGGTLVYGNKTGLRVDDGNPYRLVAFDPATGKQRVLAKEAGVPRSWSPDGKYLLAGSTGVFSMPAGTLVLKSLSWSGAFSPNGDRLYLPGHGDTLSMVSVPDWKPVGYLGDVYLNGDWAPGGEFLAVSAPGGEWAVYSREARLVWSRSSEEERARGRPFWSPDGQFVVIPGIGVGDTADGQFHRTPKDIGVPIGWNRSGTLFLGPGSGFGDEDYVKPTQFGR